mmetsp:Transcript_719/g.2177  ORF Transcript_719/g.2177 Transcript_719/m.2177 type:complete len:250 (-) Transcript_719:7-756(-)
MFTICVEKLWVHLQNALQVKRSDVQELQGIDLGVLRAEDFSVLVHALQLGLELVQLIRFHQVSLVQQDAVCKGNLLCTLVFHTLRLLLLQVLHYVLGIHNCDNAVQLVLLLDEVINKECLRNGCRISEPCGLDENGIKLLDFSMQPLQCFDQVTTNCAANASVHNLDDFVICLLCQNLLINTHLTKLVLDNGKAQLVVWRLKDVVHQRGLPRTEEACQDGHWHLLLLRHVAGGALDYDRYKKGEKAPVT